MFLKVGIDLFTNHRDGLKSYTQNFVRALKVTGHYVSIFECANSGAFVCNDEF
jgi:hypothetical protein